MGTPNSGRRTFTLTREHDGVPLDRVVRALTGSSWPAARQVIVSGKTSLDGRVIVQIAQRCTDGEVLVIDPVRPRPHVGVLPREAIVYRDANVVVVNKPSGIVSVPFGDEDPGEARRTLDALVRDALGKGHDVRGRAPLGVVHRLDKETSGLIVFARTLAAKKHLANQFRKHTIVRRYLAICEGALTMGRTFRSRLVADRGDGLRGTTRSPAPGGQLAITHVKPLQALRGATLVACRLETGRTHQIRIHLSEAGHPIVGESVYVRNYRGERTRAPRIMLHAAQLGFVHPDSERSVEYRSDPPQDFLDVFAALDGKPFDWHA
jgi:23S rRNA pseudouridine1911/1915/1917 synthase